MTMTQQALDRPSGITAEMMHEQGNLKSIAELREELAPYDGVAHFLLPSDGRTHFEMDDGWFVNLDGKRDDEAVDVFVRIDERRQATQHDWESPERMPVLEEARRVQLTKASALELTSAVGLPKTYVVKTPARLIAPQLDYWYAGQATGSRKLLVMDREFETPATPDLEPWQDGYRAPATETRTVALGTAKATLQPFGHRQLLDRAIRAIQERYGVAEEDIYVDSRKTHHSMAKAFMFVVIPEATRTMRPGDDWSGGVLIQNSLTGECATTVRCIMFRWWCRNGCTTQKSASGTYSRRGNTGGEDVYDWVGQSVHDALSRLEGEFDRVEAMTTEPIEGEVRVAVDNIIRQYKLPTAVAEAIRNQMMETSDTTMYGLMNAVTAAAQASGMPRAMSEKLMEVGGDFVAGAHRCSSCHSVLPGDGAGATGPHTHDHDSED